MAEYMICRITEKNKISVIEIISRQDYEKLRDTLAKASHYSKSIKDNKLWQEATKEIVGMYPYLSIPQLLEKYKDAIVLNYNKLLI